MPLGQLKINYKLKLGYTLLIFTLFSNGLSSTKGTLQSIQDEYADGTISQSEYLVYNMLALYAPEKLPVRYQELQVEPIKSSTLVRGELRANWDKLSSAEKEIVEPFMSRPTLTDALISPSGRFKIHYTTTGTDKTTVHFANEAARIFDYCYELEVTELGYKAPPADYGIDGPEFDIYIKNVPGTEYGSTTPEQPVSETPEDDWTSWIQVDNDYLHTLTSGLNGLRVTSAHEFFHMIHFGYRMFNESDRFFYEISGVWMEDVAFNDINDYYYYLPNFFQNPSHPFNKLDYGMSIWAHFLTKKYDMGIMRQIWERMPSNESLDAIEGALEARGSNLADALAEFAVWNCFTGENADTVQFYEEGASYPEITPNNTFDFTDKLEFPGKCDPLETRYYQAKPKESGEFSVQIDFETPLNWRYAVAIQPFDGSPWFDVNAGMGSSNLGKIQAFSTIWVLPVNVDLSPAPALAKSSKFTVHIERGNLPEQKSEIVSVVPNPFVLGRHSQVEFRYRLAHTSENVRLLILSENGLLIWKKDFGRHPDGLNKCTWNGQNQNGTKVTSGIYLFMIEGSELLGPAKFAVIH